MAKKQEQFKVIKTETLDLNFYAVQSQDGKWFKSKGQYGSGNSWVDNIGDAKIYSKPGPAKAQVTFWSKNYPEYGVPMLVKITTGKVEFLDQQERVAKSIRDREIRELKRKISYTEYSINSYIQKKNNDRLYVDKLKGDLESYQKELQKINGK